MANGGWGFSGQTQKAHGLGGRLDTSNLSSHQLKILRAVNAKPDGKPGSVISEHARHPTIAGLKDVAGSRNRNLEGQLYGLFSGVPGGSPFHLVQVMLHLLIRTSQAWVAAVKAMPARKGQVAHIQAFKGVDGLDAVVCRRLAQRIHLAVSEKEAFGPEHLPAIEQLAPASLGLKENPRARRRRH